MQAFIEIMDEIANIETIVNRNEDFMDIIATLRSVTQELLGFRCERWVLKNYSLCAADFNQMIFEVTPSRYRPKFCVNAKIISIKFYEMDKKPLAFIYKEGKFRLRGITLLLYPYHPHFAAHNTQFF